MRFLEYVLFYKKIRKVKIVKDPLFILGHWRSGTTFLQTLLSLDPQMGFLTGHQAFMPGIDLFKSQLLTNILNRGFPKKRAMDNMPRGLSVPEEEEFVLTTNTTIGSYHSLWFPRNDQYFEKYTLMKNINQQELANWKNEYVFLLKKILFYKNNKEQLMLKNPPNTARIKILLELFPQAKFVNIHRNPYDVFSSMKNMYKKSIQNHFFQKMSDEEIDEKILKWYEELMKQYMAQVPLIPPANLVDIKYEQFEKDPLTHLESLYQHFQLDFSTAKPLVQAHLMQIKTYKKNQLNLTPAQRDTIFNRWSFAFEYFGYSR